MHDLLLHPQTEKAVSKIIDAQPHALLVTGEKGAGKATVARFIAQEALGQANLATLAQYVQISPEAKSIGIEEVRQLNKFTQLKTPGKAAIRRVAVILESDTMTREAQNALLKILEEPPKDTILLLTADQPQNLLPTIHSRVQALQILAPTQEQAVTHFQEQGHNSADINKTYSISGGQIGLMSALLSGGTEHELAVHIDAAKKLYQMSVFERLSQVDTIAKQKDEIPSMLYACKRIGMSALEQAANKGQTKVVTSWHNRLEHICAAEEALPKNPNTKLLLTDLFMNL